jgi:Holliday junction resolvase
MTGTQERGYAFESYVAELFRREQFAVLSRPSAANRRQVDLFASRGDERYLVEVKWRASRRSGSPMSTMCCGASSGVRRIWQAS